MADIFELNKLTYVVVFGASVFNLATGILEPTVAPYLGELGASNQDIGIILSARWLIVAIASIPFAILSSQIGHIKVLYLSVLSAMLGGLILVLLDGIQAIHLFYYAIGLSSAAAWGPAAAILAENDGSKRIAAFALFATTWMLPPAVGAGFSAWWFRNTFQYSPNQISTIFLPASSFLIIGSGLLGILLFIFRKNDVQLHKKKISTVSQFRILFAPVVAVPFTLLMTVNFLSGAGAGATLPFLPPYLKSLGASPSELSLLVLALNIAMGVAIQFTAPLTKRFGELQVYTLSTVLSVVCLVSIAFSDDLYIASLFYILRGAFANMSSPIGQSLILSYVDERIRATGGAVGTNIRWVGWVIFSPISGNIIDNFGYKTSFVFTGILYVIATIIFVFVNSSMPNLEQIKEKTGLMETNQLYPITDNTIG